MAPTPDPRIISAERLESGIVIKFEDGRCAFFSNKLLHDALPKAKELDESVIAW